MQAVVQHGSFVKRNITLYYFTRFFLSLMFLMPVISLFFQKEIGLTAGEIFIIEGTFSVVNILMEVPSGYLADSWRRKDTLLLGVAITLMGFCVYTIADNFWLVLLAEMILGIGFSFMSGADTALLYDSLKQHGKKREFKKIEGFTFFIAQLGSITGGLVGGFVAQYSLRWTIYIEVMAILCALISTLFMTEPAREHHKHTSWKGILQVTYETFFVHKKLGSLILYSAFINCSTLTFVWFSQSYMSMIGLPTVYFGVQWVIVNTTAACFALSASRLERYVSRRHVLLGLPILIAFGYIALGSYPYVWALPFMLCFYVVRGISRPTLSTLINDNTTADVRATVLSLENMGNRIVFSCLVPCIYLMIKPEHLHIPGTMTVVGSIFFILSISAYFYWRKQEM